MTDVIIAEKPNVARKISSIFSNIKYRKYKNIGYFENGHVVVISAVGHVYRLDTDKKGYPVFDVQWKPSYLVDKKLSYTRPYVELAEMWKDADRIIIATDFDIEGSLIGYNLARFAMTDQRLYRMKFSSITYAELKRAWENLQEFDFYNALAGEARHKIDWFYGINLSRFLMNSLKTQNISKVLSIGRVQAPSLSLLIEREESIENFIPKEFYYVNLRIQDYVFSNDKRFDSIEELENYISNLKNRGFVNVEDSIEEIAIYPLNLTDLQQLAYYNYRLSPSKTQSIAQELYEKGYISYPRTSSNVYPKDLNVKKILEQLKQYGFDNYISELLQQDDIRPRKGKKTDPAHPAIYPTGEIPRDLNKQQKQVYELVLRSFIATMYRPVVIKKKVYSIDIGDVFIAKSLEIVDKSFLDGLFNLAPYNKIEEKKILLETGEYDVELERKTGKTKPPNRYNEASIISKLEQLRLGTKATRAMILDTLFDRGYIRKTKGKIFVNHLGKIVKKVLYPYVPDLFDEKFTRELEEDLENIQTIKDADKVIEKAKIRIESIFENLIGKEQEIGELLKENLY